MGIRTLSTHKLGDKEAKNSQLEEGLGLIKHPTITTESVLPPL